MNDFVDISEDIIWRRNQLLTCKILPFKHNLAANHKEFLIQHSIPIIYSLWEGFVQNAFQTYVRELNKLNLNRHEYCYSIILHSIETRFPQFREYPIEYGKRERFMTNLDNFLTDTFSITNKIDTESNVGLDVLNKLLYKFNLQKIPDHPYKQKLKDLLLYRNRIAHGDISLVINSKNIDDFIKKISDMISLIEDLMDLLLLRFKEGFNINKSYLRP